MDDFSLGFLAIHAEILPPAGISFVGFDMRPVRISSALSGNKKGGLGKIDRPLNRYLNLCSRKNHRVYEPILPLVLEHYGS